jgi:hypothetical protein
VTTANVGPGDRSGAVTDDVALVVAVVLVVLPAVRELLRRVAGPSSIRLRLGGINCMMLTDKERKDGWMDG